MSRYFLSPEAQTDIVDIREYTNQRWGREQAEQYTLQLRQRMQWLVSNPALGLKRDEIGEGYRSFAEGQHVIFYRVAGDDIEIIGIPHRRMDIEQQLGKESSRKLTHERPDLDATEIETERQNL
jgi:toxin ParE1/3/4